MLDSRGQLIGMNTAMYSPSGSSSGVGFAIPVDSLKFAVSSIIETGKVVRPSLGINYLPSTQARFLGVSKGVLILAVAPNSPAAKSGLRGTTRTTNGSVVLGDVIVDIDGVQLSSERDLFMIMESKSVGQICTVTVLRCKGPQLALDPRASNSGLNSDMGGEYNSIKVKIELEEKPSMKSLSTGVMRAAKSSSQF